MRRYRVLATVAVLGLLACEDDKTQPVAPTAVESPAPESALTPTSGPNLAKQLNAQIASVCKAYRKAATQAKKDLIKAPDDVELQAAVKSYDELIDDACN